MQAKPAFRKSERSGHQSIIKIEDDLTPYYAASCNLSETGMYFKSLFKVYPGAHILVKIDDDPLTQNKVSAKVVWCKKIENSDKIPLSRRRGSPPAGKEFWFKGIPPNYPANEEMKTPSMNRDGFAIRMENL